MKIRVTQSVEVDPKAWALEYGIDTKDVREDVKESFAHICQQLVDQIGCQPKKERRK